MSRTPFQVSVMFQAPSRRRAQRLADYFGAFGYRAFMLTMSPSGQGRENWTLSLRITRSFDDAATVVSERRMARIASHYGATYAGWSAACARRRPRTSVATVVTEAMAGPPC